MARKPDALAARLTRLRLAAALTSAELARRAGISKQLLHKIESGQTPYPRVDHLAKLCTALNVSLAAFDGVSG